MFFFSGVIVPAMIFEWIFSNFITFISWLLPAVNSIHFPSDSSVLTGLFTLGGAIVGGFITAIVTYITTERQNAAEEKRLRIQLGHERSQYSATLKKECYTELLVMFSKAQVALFNGEHFPAQATKEDQDRFHSCMNDAILLAGEKVQKLRQEFVSVYSEAIEVMSDPAERNKISDRLKAITDELRIAVRAELGIDA